MNEMNVYVVFLFQVLGQMFGAIDRAVLSARTTEGYLQMFKTAFEEAFHMMVHQLIHTLQERQDLAVTLQKINDRLVQTRHLFVFVVLTRVMGRTAVEHIPAAVTGLVRRKTAFIREGVDRD